VLNVKLDVLPKAPGIPAVEVLHFQQRPDLSVFPYEALDLGNEMIIVILDERGQR
jgi:hypothetical protein